MMQDDLTGEAQASSRRGWLYGIAAGSAAIVMLVALVIWRNVDNVANGSTMPVMDMGAGPMSPSAMNGMTANEMSPPGAAASGRTSTPTGPVQSGATVGRSASSAVLAATSTRANAPLYPPYVPRQDEPEVEVKAAAASFMQTLTTYAAGAGTVEWARSVLTQFGGDPLSAAIAAPLMVSDASSAGQIIYPQFGGLTANSASVMVVLRQHLVGSGGASVVGRTADVRLERRGDAWMVASLASVGDTAAPLSSLASPAALAALADVRLELVDTVRWDLQGGRVDDQVANLLVSLADRYQLAVTTLASGHPYEVFGTDRVSNHTRGRAVDLWAVDGSPIVAYRSTPEQLLSLLEAASAFGVTEIGSPWQLDLPGSFTDPVHQDHLHLGFRSG